MPRRKIEQKRGQEVSILSRVFKESYQEGDIAKNLKKKVSEQPLYLLERGIFQAEGSTKCSCLEWIS